MMPPRPIVLACRLVATLAPATALAQVGAPAPAVMDCMIQPHQVVQVGTAAPGVIQSVRVDRGDMVRRGQPLVQLNAEVERAALAVARERASQVGELQATRGAHEAAVREAERAAKLVEENFVSRTYFDKQQAEAQVAAGRGEQAQERIKLARREVELASAQLGQRTVVSPIDGVVVDRYVAPGEYVEQKPVLRIAAIDPLRVDVLVPAAHFGRVAVGGKASVVPELFSRTAHVANVTHVDRVVDAASNTFRVRLELPNPGGALPPGLRCKADLGLPALDGQGGVAAFAAPPLGAMSPAGARVPVASPVHALAAAPVASPLQRATQADVRRTEPVEPAQPRTGAPGRVAPRDEVRTALALARRVAPVEPAGRSHVAPRSAARTATADARRADAGADSRTVAVSSTAVKRVTRTPVIEASPPPPRLKMAGIDWPTTVASVTPAR